MRAAVPLLLLASCSSSSQPVGRPPDAPPAAKPPETAAFDEGAFTVAVGGEQVGSETFKVVAVAGGAHDVTAVSTWKLGGTDVKVTTGITLDATWKPTKGTLTHVEGDKSTEMTLSRKDGVLEVMSAAAKEPFREQEATSLFVHDRVLVLWEPICSLGGADLKELKVFPGLKIKIGPRKPVKMPVEGAKQLTYHVVTSATGASFELVCDGPKMVLLRQPAVRLIAARAGYEQMAAAVAKAESRKPDLPAGVQEMERTMGTFDGGRLACSLMLPAERRSPLPSVIMLSGSGAQDRDGDTPVAGAGITVALYKHMAIALAQSGIASLRCDDRGAGGTKAPLDKIVLDTFASDALAQVAKLRSEPGLDPARVGVIGHSEGGVVAPMVATQDKGIKAVVLLAAMGRPLDVISMEQREAALKATGMPAADIKKEQERYGRIYASIKAGKGLPAEVEGDERQALEPLVGYLASHFKHDPLKTLRGVKQPVLVAQGGQDFHISARDEKLIVDTLKKSGNKKVVVKDYPELGHLFAPVKTRTVADYSDPELSVDPAFIGDVVTFLREAL